MKLVTDNVSLCFAMIPCRCTH